MKTRVSPMTPEELRSALRDGRVLELHVYDTTIDKWTYDSTLQTPESLDQAIHWVRNFYEPECSNHRILMLDGTPAEPELVFWNDDSVLTVRVQKWRDRDSRLGTIDAALQTLSEMRTETEAEPAVSYCAVIIGGCANTTTEREAYVMQQKIATALSDFARRQPYDLTNEEPFTVSVQVMMTDGTVKDGPTIDCSDFDPD